MTAAEAAAWREYDMIAAAMARKGLAGKEGDPLPVNVSQRALMLINDDPGAFQERIRASAYALAMESSAAGGKE